MDKYFEFKYWQEIIGLCVTGLVIIIIITWCIVTLLVDFLKRKSKKWEYNYLTNRWEKVTDND